MSTKPKIKSGKQNLSILEDSKQRKKSQSKNDNKTKNLIPSSKPPKSTTTKDNNQQAKKYLQKTLNILSHRFNIKNPDHHYHPTPSILNLSTSVYKIVKENIATSKRNINLEDKQNYPPNFNSRSCHIPNQSLLKSLKKPQNQSKDNILKQNKNHNSSKQDIILINKNHNSNSKSNRQSRKVLISQKDRFRQQRAASVCEKNYSVLQASQICGEKSSSLFNHQPNNNLPSSSENNIFVKRRSNSTLDTYFRDKFGTNADDEQAVEKKLRVIKALKKSQQIVNKSNRSHIQSSMILTSCDINQKGVVMEKLKNKKSQKLKVYQK